MIVAVAFVRMMQVTVDQVIHMVGMGDGLMAAAGAVHVLCVVALARVALGTVGGVGRAHLEPVLVDVALVRMMKVTVVKVINVLIVLDGCVVAIGTVLVRMVLVNEMLDAHGFCPLSLFEVPR